MRREEDHIAVPNIEGIQFIQNPFPVDIKPEASFEIILFLSVEHQTHSDSNINGKMNFRYKYRLPNFITLI